MTITSNRYAIKHRTRYLYHDSVAICQNQLMMTPRDMQRVCCNDVMVDIQPRPTLQYTHADYFGNPIQTFSIEMSHKELSVTVSSDVEVTAVTYPAPAATVPWELVRDAIAEGKDTHWFDIAEFKYASSMVLVGKDYAQYALQSFLPGRPILEAALDLTKRVNRDFKYDRTVTDVTTRSEQSFKLKAGVCQDFAHVQISCLRSIGLPARYVSGYLRTLPPEGKPRLVGADQSHAWLSIYAGEALGWVELDPTNACLAQTDHIPICFGRDYRDVAPMRGVVLGGGRTTLQVSVDVEPLPVHSSY